MPPSCFTQEGQALRLCQGAAFLLAEYVRQHATLDDLMPLIQLLRKGRKCMGLKG